MALHKVKLPRSAVDLFRVVVLQKRLLKALTDPDLDSDSVDTAWVQAVWNKQSAEWVRKFCLGGQESILHPLKALAAADLDVREGIYSEFCRQSKVFEMLDNGGDFVAVTALDGVTPQLAAEVKKIFGRCYDRLGHITEQNWFGYEFNGNRRITKASYKEDFCSEHSPMVVCPYCDGDIGTPQLDHYYFKAGYPLLGCSPWNLVPVCTSCNDASTAKGERPAITTGPPPSSNDWLHPFFRPASEQVRIELDGNPPVPTLKSPDGAEQIRLDNHTHLIQTLGKRWSTKAAAYFDVLVGQVNDKIRKNPAKTVNDLVQSYCEDHELARGRTASSMIHAAVCRAVIDGRPEYLEEFAAPNAPALD